MTDAATIAHRYIETWNETDPARRRARLADLFSEDATFVDPILQGDGLAGIETVMSQVHAQFAGHRFTLVGAPDGFGRYVRLSWALAPDGGEPPLKGTDIVVVEQGRLTSVTGFFDQVPA